MKEHEKHVSCNVQEYKIVSVCITYLKYFVSLAQDMISEGNWGEINSYICGSNDIRGGCLLIYVYVPLFIENVTSKC